MKKLEHGLKIDKVMRSLQSAFNRMNASSSDKRLILNMEKGKELPYLTIENNLFVFFEIEGDKLSIVLESLSENLESTNKLKEFPIESSFEACQYILTHYFNTRIMSKMEEEYYS